MSIIVCLLREVEHAVFCVPALWLIENLVSSFSQPISNQSNRMCQMTRVFPPSAPVTFAILERKGNWTDLTVAKNCGTVTRDRKGNWPIADHLVPSNDPRNNFGTHFCSSSPPFSKVANAWDVIDLWQSKLLYMLLFNFVLGLSFIFFQTHYHIIIIHFHTQKQEKTKFKPRIKLNHNI